MPKDHARKNVLTQLKTGLGVKHHDAIAILDDDRADTITQLIAAGAADTYAEAVAVIEDPRNQTMCDKCGWTFGMVCPECPGCGCYTGQCTGWRHAEYSEHDEPDVYECEGCGFVVEGFHCCECGASHEYHCAC